MSKPEHKHELLVVDDEESMRFFLREALSRENYEVTLASTGEEAIEKIREKEFHAVVLDIRMSKVDGLEVLSEAVRLKPELPVILMTAYGSKQVAMEAIQKGAYDYFTKPFDLNEMRIVVKRAVEKRMLEDEIRSLRKKDAITKFNFPGIVGHSVEMQSAFELISKVFNNDVNVIIYGESGTGKELVATLIHENGPRKDKQIVRLNCAAIPETLLESEMFGHEKGSFTGAVARKTGKLEQADGGTLFLDEVGDMSLTTQAKLLRALENKVFERLGGREPISVDIRLIAATNKDLTRMAQENKFREDLYFRLNVVPIHLPPLRQRRTDIPFLVEHFLEITCEKLNKTVTSISRGAMSCFMDYEWPGNVRELENVIQRAVITTKDDILDEDSLPEALRAGREVPYEGRRSVSSLTEHLDTSLSEIVERISEAAERQLIIDALDKTEWSRTKTAELLRICRKSLHNKMKKYGIKEP